MRSFIERINSIQSERIFHSDYSYSISLNKRANEKSNKKKPQNKNTGSSAVDEVRYFYGIQVMAYSHLTLKQTPTAETDQIVYYKLSNNILK